MPGTAVPHIVDNSAVPHLTINLGVSSKTEHFARWQHYMRYLVTMGYTVVHLVKTCDMHANTLTKVEHKSAFFVFRKLAMNLGGKY